MSCFFVKNPKIFSYNKAKQVLSTFEGLKYKFLTFLRKSCFNDELIIKIVLSIRTVADVFNNYFVLSKKLRNVWLVGPRNTFSSTSFITHWRTIQKILVKMSVSFLTWLVCTGRNIMCVLSVCWGASHKHCHSTSFQTLMISFLNIKNKSLLTLLLV